MKDQMVRLVFFVTHNNQEIGVYRVKYNGSWVYNYAVHRDILSSNDEIARARKLRRDFQLKSFRKFQMEEKWRNDFKYLIDNLGDIEMFSDIYSYQNYVHPEYREVINTFIEMYISTVTYEWDRDVAHHDGPSRR